MQKASVCRISETRILWQMQMVDQVVSYSKGCACYGESERELGRGRHGWLNSRGCLEVSLISGDTATLCRAPFHPLQLATLLAIPVTKLIRYTRPIQAFSCCPDPFQNSFFPRRFGFEMESVSYARDGKLGYEMPLITCNIYSFICRSYRFIE